jgi:hypothetical protein
MVLNDDMALHGDCEPGSAQKVHEQVGLHESLNGVRRTSLQGFSVVILAVRGARSATLRMAPLMRAEFEDLYAVRASSGDAPRRPSWYFSRREHPFARLQGPQFGHLQRGPDRRDPRMGRTFSLPGVASWLWLVKAQVSRYSLGTKGWRAGCRALAVHASPELGAAAA